MTTTAIDRVAVTKLSGPELVRHYNSLTGVKPVKRFADRADAVKRVLKALGEAQAPEAAPEAPAAAESPAAAQPKAAPAAPAAKRHAPKPSKAAASGTAAGRAYAAAAGGKEPRPGSKRGQLLAALRTAKGITVEQMMERFGWNPRYAEYIIRWAAWSFQNPATPPRVALVFRGDEGTGKGVFGRAMVRAFGTHGQRVQNISHVAGRFNAHMRHCCMFFADEVTLVNDEQEGNLKGMITEPTLPIEAKGVDIVHAENHLHVVMSSNREFIIPAGIGARRFAMFDVPPTR